MIRRSRGDSVGCPALAGQQSVRGLRDHLVHRAPCHRHGDDLVTDQRRGPERERAQGIAALAAPNLGNARRTRRRHRARRRTHRWPRRASTPRVPVGHEGGDLWITMRSCHQQIPQVAHRVGLDVVHVAQTTKRRLVERVVTGTRRSRCRRRRADRSASRMPRGRTALRSSVAPIAVLMSSVRSRSSRRMSPAGGSGRPDHAAQGIGEPSHSTSKNWAATRSVCLCAWGCS